METTAEFESLKDFHDVLKRKFVGSQEHWSQLGDWDPVILHVLIRKLDQEAHIICEQSPENPRELQTLSHFLKVLQNRFQSLEAVGAREKTKQIGAKE